MKLPKFLFALVLLLSLVACQINPINPALRYENKSDEAVVLVEIDSPRIVQSITLNSGKTYTTDPTLSQTSISHNLVYKDIIAIPVKVGESFSIKSIAFPARVYMGMTGTFTNHSGYTFRSPALKIEQAGIYFYGSYFLNGSSLAFTNQLTNDMLGRAKNKFYQNFGQLKTLNFSWPEASFYSNYRVSGSSQISLRENATVRVSSVSISSADGIELTCRLFKKLDQVDGLPLEKYIESALLHELKAGEKFVNENGKPIQGILKKLSFSTFSDASITMGVEFRIAELAPFYVESTYRYEGSFIGEKACRLVTENIPSATRSLLENFLSDERFKAAFNP